MILKVVLNLNSTVLNSRDANNNVVAVELSASTNGELKNALTNHFGSPNWSSVSGSLKYKATPTSAPTVINLDDNAGMLPDIPTNANGDKVVIITAVNTHMKAGLTSEEEARWLALVEKAVGVPVQKVSYNYGRNNNSNNQVVVPTFKTVAKPTVIVEEDDDYEDDDDKEEVDFTSIVTSTTNTIRRPIPVNDEFAGII